MIKVSIIIPTYNRANLIEDTLLSVQNQKLKEWECLVVDDGSSDNTKQIVNKISSLDRRFIFIERPLQRRKGASSCRNIGIENARGNYIQFLDSDDIISCSKLLTQFEILKNENYLSFSFCKWGSFKNDLINKKIFLDFDIYKNFYSGIDFLNSLINSRGYLPINSFLFSKAIIEKSGGWDESISINDDGEFLSRIIVIFDKAFYTELPYVLYRLPNKKKNLSSYSTKLKVEQVIKSWEIIFNRYNHAFKGKESKYRIFIKKKVSINTANTYPEILDCDFFKELNLYFFKNNLIERLRKSYIHKLLRYVKSI